MIVSSDLELEVCGSFWGGGKGYHTYRNDAFNTSRISKKMTKEEVRRVAGDFESIQNFRLTETYRTETRKVLLEG